MNFWALVNFFIFLQIKKRTKLKFYLSLQSIVNVGSMKQVIFTLSLFEIQLGFKISKVSIITIFLQLHEFDLL